MKSDGKTRVPVVTIDGPSGVGKGTAARLLADRLGWHLLDSGALYRVLALAALREQISPQAEARLGEMAEALDIRFETGRDGQERVILAGEDVAREIRTEDCGGMASQIAALPAVRAGLKRLQQDFRVPPGLVADGRDMGTVIFPDAELKIFLTASPAERARRRHKQLKEKGIDANVAELESAIAERDRRDAQRASSPLKPADDAVEIDTTDRSIDQVFDLILSLVEERTGLGPAS